MIVTYKNQKIKIPVKKIYGFGKIKGLMFKSKITKNLLFEFGKESTIRIHSWFVFFDFLALWLDDKNKIIEWKIVKPFTSSVKPKKPFSKLIEIPLNNQNRKIHRFFVGKGKI